MADDQLSQMWEDAKKEYTAETGRDVRNLPQNVTPETLTTSLNRQIRAREEWSSEQRDLWDALHATGEWAQPVIGFVMTLASGVPVVGPAQVVLGALQCTIEASNGVAHSLQQVLVILERLRSLSKRIRHYMAIELSPELREILVRQLKVLLKICAISTRQMQEKSPVWARTKLMARHAFKIQDGVSALLEELGKGIEDESLQSGTETLVTAKQIQLIQQQAFEAAQRQFADLTRAMTELTMRSGKRESLSPQNWFKSKGSEATRNEAVAFLDPSDFAKAEFDRHTAAAKAIGEGLGNWIRREDLYQGFKAGNHSRLLVSGMSGSGKSFLAHNVISDLLATDSQYVGYYFFSREADKAVTPAKALCTMASQIAAKSSPYTRYLMDNCKRADLGRFDVAWKLLFYDKFIDTRETRKHPVYLVIDAPGALSRSERANLCSMLQEVGTKGANLRVVVFGRPEIREELGKDTPTIEVTSAKNGFDVNQYVRAKLMQLNNLKRLPLESQGRIADAVSRKADGLFVWAELALAEVERKNVSSEASISAILDNVPSGLEDALSHSLEQVAASLSSERLLELNCLLAWVSCIKTPMTLDLLNSFHRLDGTYDGDVVNLRNSLLAYSTIFKLDVSDDVWLDDQDFYSGSTPSLQRLASEQNILEDLICRADPKSVSVAFCHTSVLDYVRSHQRRPIASPAVRGSKNPIQSIFWAQQKISACLMQLLLKQETATEVNHAKRYAERHWLGHLEGGVPPNSATGIEIKEIVGLLIRLLVTENNNRDIQHHLWLRNIEHNHIGYSSAKSIQKILTDPLADPVFKSQSREIRKWRESFKVNPLHVFKYAMDYCGRAWVKYAPQPPFSNQYTVAAIHYDIALRHGAHAAWSIYPKNSSFSGDEIEEAAKTYTDKRDAVFKCRVARALALARNNGSERSMKDLHKIKDPKVRWEADLALARLFTKKSQWDQAIGHAQNALKGLISRFIGTSTGQSYYRFVVDCYKVIADCWKQKMKVTKANDPSYNQYAMNAAEYMRRAVRLQPTDQALLIEVIYVLHSVALRLMVEGTAIDAEDFLHDEFYTSDEEGEEDSEGSDAGSKAGRRHSELSDTRRGLPDSRKRPGYDERTLSENSTTSSHVSSKHRHRFSKSSFGSASFFRMTSNQGHDSVLEPWKQASHEVDESDTGLASPRLYLDNYDDNLNSYICHSKVMTLLQDLDSKAIVGREYDDGFDFKIPNEQNRLYRRLSQVLQRDTKLVKIMAFAACNSDREHMDWFIDLFGRAVVFSGKMKQQRQLMFLNTHLGTIQSAYAGKHDDAIHLWESVINQPLPPNRKAGFPGQPQADALKNLSRLCISLASSNPSKAQEYIGIADRYSKLPQANLASQIGTERAQNKLHLATWYHNQGNHEAARQLVRDDIIWALDILTDDDPGNDFDGFYVLANALRAVQDTRNHLAARHAMRQYDEEDSAISTADKKQKSSNNTDAYCSGLCLQEHKQWDNMMLCTSCPDLNLCPNCFGLFKHGDLYLKICSPRHEFLQVPRMKHSFTRGNQVVVDDRVMELKNWVNELRDAWKVKSGEGTSRWRRHSSMLSGSDEQWKPERKRDAFKRLFSNDKVKH